VEDERGRFGVRGPKDRLVLVRLALSAGQIVSADALIESLWGQGEPPEDPSNALQVKISRLRKLIGADRLRTCAPGYVLEADETDVDALEFRRLVRAARAARQDAGYVDALSALNRALALWRGAPLLDVEGDFVVETERMRLADERVDALEERIDVELELGRHGEVVGDLQALVRAHPLRERLWAQLMTALYREGRQADALQAFAEVRSALVDQLGIEPGPELRALQSRILAHDPDLYRGQAVGRAGAPAPAPTRAAGNLREPRTSFVGRDSELTDVAVELGRRRLLTLTGPGGVGKTRLAIESGLQVREKFPNGVWIADLTDAHDYEGVVNVVAVAAGVRDVDDPLLAANASVALIDRLTAKFSEGRTLLILDHCEHVLPGAAEAVEAFLSRCESTSVLAASREPLNVEGECELRVAPLSTRDAVALFVDRARALRPSFSLSPSERSTVERICRRLDHIPLALELAAARVKVLPLDQIDSRLDDRFTLLASRTRRSDRRQTLRATVDWSYDVLGDDERTAFEQLSLFKGGGSYEAAEELCVGAGLDGKDVLEVMSRLVDKSMLIAEVGRTEPARYFMLETLRDYGIERLAESGRLEEARERHARLFLRRAEEAEPLLRGPDQERWLAAMRLDEDNHLAALDWAIAAGAIEVGLRLGIALGWYWYLAGRPNEGRRRLVVLVQHREAAPALRARAMGVAGLLAERVHDLAHAYALTEEAMEIAAGAGDEFVSGMVTAQHGQVLGRVGRTQAAFKTLRDAVAIFGRLEAAWESGAATLAVGYNHLREGDLGAAESAIAWALERFEQVGDRWSSIRSLTALAGVAEAARGRDAARAYMTRAVCIAREAGFADVANRLDELIAGVDATPECADGEPAGVTSWPVTPDARPVACNSLGFRARQEGDLDLARRLHEEALSWYRTIEWLGGTAVARAGLAAVAHAEGGLEQAEALYRQALDDAEASGDGHGLAVVLEGLAGLAIRLGDAERAGLLLGGADAIRAKEAIQRIQVEQRDVDRIRDIGATVCGRECFWRTIEEGERASPADAVQLAREALVASSSTSAVTGSD
jgi:predicted ATPase/DNA-binding SARP family transcriptional activator